MFTTAKHKSFSAIFIPWNMCGKKFFFYLKGKNHIVELSKNTLSVFCIYLGVCFVPINVTLHFENLVNSLQVLFCFNDSKFKSFCLFFNLNYFLVVSVFFFFFAIWFLLSLSLWPLWNTAIASTYKSFHTDRADEGWPSALPFGEGETLSRPEGTGEGWQLGNSGGGSQALLLPSWGCYISSLPFIQP